MKRFLVTVLTLLICLSFVSCSSVKSFSEMTQEEQMTYIERKIQSTEGVNCKLSSLSQVTVTQGDWAGDTCYYSEAETPEGDIIYIYTAKEGVLRDSTFTLKRKSEIDDFFKGYAEKYFPECDVRVSLEMEQVPLREYSSADSIETLLDNNVFFAHIRLYTEKREEISKELLSLLAKDLSFISGRISGYYIEDLSSLDNTGSQSVPEYLCSRSIVRLGQKVGD